MRGKSLLQIADDQFCLDLDVLMEENEGKWVAYHGAHRIGIYDSTDSAEKAFIARGIPESEAYLARIERKQEIPRIGFWK